MSSTPIYDALCRAMPGPSGPDEEQAVPAQGAEVDGAAGQDAHDGAATANGKVSMAHDGQGNGAVTRNGRVERNTAADGSAGAES
jgi:hypothetical protein